MPNRQARWHQPLHALRLVGKWHARNILAAAVREVCQGNLFVPFHADAENQRQARSPSARKQVVVSVGWNACETTRIPRTTVHHVWYLVSVKLNNWKREWPWRKAWKNMCWQPHLENIRKINGVWSDLDERRCELLVLIHKLSIDQTCFLLLSSYRNGSLVERVHFGVFEITVSFGWLKLWTSRSNLCSSSPIRSFVSESTTSVVVNRSAAGCTPTILSKTSDLIGISRSILRFLFYFWFWVLVCQSPELIFTMHTPYASCRILLVILLYWTK